MNLRNLVQMQTLNPAYGQFATDIMQRGPDPRNGTKTDQAHPPIHPTKAAQPGDLQADEARLYDFIVRHFLACVSWDARGLETRVLVNVAGETFKAVGLQIVDRGFLEVYSEFETWNSKVIPKYERGEGFRGDISMAEGLTTAPNLLTEPDLIALMDKHGIGTDATHADHIEKIKDRMYVGLRPDNRFIPGHLGLGLVEGYDEMGFEMSKPNLRAELETDLKEICGGTKQKDEVLRVQLAKYRDIFVETERRIDLLIRAVARNFGPNNNPPPPGHGGGGGGGGGGGDGPPPPGNPPGGAPFPQAPPCGCGTASVLKTTMKEGQNQGKRFFACTKGREEGCGFFLWEEESGGTAHPMDSQPLPNCGCGSKSVLRRVMKQGPNKGRKFFACTKGKDAGCDFFQWDGAPGGGGGNGASPSGVPQNNTGSAPPPPVCRCGLASALKTTLKPGENQGRQFFTCSKGRDQGCGFFEWREEGERRDPSSSREEREAPVCRCGVGSVLRTTMKEGPNQGRKFFTCMKPREEGCGFFEWEDASGGGESSLRGAGGPPRAAPSQPVPQCGCGSESVLKTTIKEGPNRGRKFFACLKGKDSGCGFFEWQN